MLPLVNHPIPGHSISSLYLEQSTMAPRPLAGYRPAVPESTETWLPRFKPVHICCSDPSPNTLLLLYLAPLNIPSTKLSRRSKRPCKLGNHHGRVTRFSTSPLPTAPPIADSATGRKMTKYQTRKATKAPPLLVLQAAPLLFRDFDDNICWPAAFSFRNNKMTHFLQGPAVLSHAESISDTPIKPQVRDGGGPSFQGELP